MDFEQLLKKSEEILQCIEDGYFVGGCVRDTLIGKKEIKDIDIIVPNLSEKRIECLRKKSKKSGFLYKKKKPVFTIKKNRLKIDMTPVQGTIEEDLKKRDFTINAVAIVIKSLKDKQPIIIDPLNGIEDIRNRILKPINENSIKEDPIRILRGIRLKSENSLNYHPLFLNFTEKYGKTIKKEPMERIREELIKILNLKNPYIPFFEMRKLKILYEIFPHLKKQEEIPPSGVHEYTLIIHSLKTVENIIKTLNKPNKRIECIVKEIKKKNYFENFTGRELLILTALLHDIGKPETAKEKDGKLSFFNHDNIGERIVKKILPNLGFGKKITEDSAKIIRLHLRPIFLYQLRRERNLSGKAIGKFILDSDNIFPFVIVHSIADLTATSDHMEKTVGKFTEFIAEELLPVYKKFLNLKPLLTGKDIIEIKGTKPGKDVGKIKRKLTEKQLSGTVKTVEDAVKFVKGYSI